MAAKVTTEDADEQSIKKEMDAQNLCCSQRKDKWMLSSASLRLQSCKLMCNQALLLEELASLLAV